MRVIVAGIVGGIVMFLWGFAAHMLLDIGESGIKTLPDAREAPVVAAMKENINEPGLYFMPGMDMSRKPTDEEWAAWTAKYEAGPTVFFVYGPSGETPMSPRQLGIEFASNVLAALVGAFMLSWTVPSFGKRVALATLIGLAAWLSIDVSYWDWYRFPAGFVNGELIEQVAGWFLTGLVMALVLKPKPIS